LDSTIPINSNHYRIADALCAAVTDVLLPATGDWFRRPPRNGHLRVRVGRGRATYCQQQRHHYTITFGVRMVAEKCVPELAAHWLTTREIHRHGYWAGRPDLGELLAHTACHEFAHLVQQVNGWWRRGSVHNRPFYDVLDRLHREGMADAVLAHLIPYWDDEPVDMTASVPVAPRNRRPVTDHSYRVGDRVRFEARGGREIVGRIRRVNRVTATVIPEDRRYRVSYFRVPFALLDTA
jgi:hypothetical protein